MSPTPLNQLEKGFKAIIHDIVPNASFGHLDESVGQRLIDLGFNKGVTAVRLGNQSQFSLREAEACKILCLPEPRE